MSRADEVAGASSSSEANVGSPAAPTDRASSSARRAEAQVTLVWRPGCASCAAAKQFLIDHGIPFESVNPVEPAGQSRWMELGSPRVPSLLLDERMTAIYHVSQVASLLGLTPAQRTRALRLAWDLSMVVQAWSEQLATISWELMSTPTPSRGRSVRELTINVHEPLREMEVAWETGRFTWNTGRDEVLASDLADAEELRAYSEARSAGWIAFLSSVGEELEQRDPDIRAGGETLSFSALLDSQRLHAAFHYRQLQSFLAAHDAASEHPLDLARLEGLQLPEVVF